MSDIFWWVVYPYICLTIMIFGSLYRFAFRQLTWAAPSTEFFEKKWLKWGSPLFHYGILLAFIGHIMGIIIPLRFYNMIGVSNHLYHLGAVYGGSIAGIMLVAGLIILLIRKVVFDPVRVHATFADFYSVIALLIISGIGLYITLFLNVTPEEFDYRSAIGPWFRSLFTLSPDYLLMTGIPVLFKVHTLLAFGLFASIPFTRLVHFYSLPATYPGRAPQQYRSRARYQSGRQAD
ncbi:respiratory nitrate reductase subunit gamma [Virgibacillus dakarensis]|uniref:Nitrate reductase subunit gamma n=1 Tax=Lentibacillus populi TaxID=1827502 RepID=A0A9W5U208_9BACI|nr:MULTISPECIES: respiratory nitrate reductase subunit gamma [Bacillaceae]MBT2214907.1 respiratory nitrate reductase subunit gamma [Virgibacillus dakarensis]MTW88151.1 respiratory nitrate reductase subunit gamma [Virgibacillus dakarensis]GGB60641.1 nitrate reductase subunit gamma [Lentibacillus populi]